MKKVLTIILDGFGLRDSEHGNAVKRANMNFFNSLWDEYPHSVLEASGEYVGLPDGAFGNSEVCHEVIGLGKKIKQKLTITHEEIDRKTILNNYVFQELINHVKQNDSTLHLMGLVSNGCVHSDYNYMLKLLDILKEKGIKRVIFHAITDGRDTGVHTSVSFLRKLDEKLTSLEIGKIGTICGRFYAMDRDNNFDRIKQYYDLVTSGIGYTINDYERAINNLYKKDITDEFLLPMQIKEKCNINDNDGFLWLNFRSDRAREILNALTDKEFKEFKQKTYNNVKFTMLFEQDDVDIPHLLELKRGDLYPLGEYLSDLKLTQARVAETEKYSHVTYFFNAEKSKKFPMCTNYLIPSPKVSNYAETPLMSAIEISKQLKKCMENDYDFILVNFANPDMIGHTGDLNSATIALKGLDKILENVINAANDNFYKVIITADHGNCDEMLDANEEVVTTHSTSPVPFLILDKKVILREKGDLTMVAPTILKYMDIAIPKEMKETKNLLLDE